jgi:hypothetical protein
MVMIKTTIVIESHDSFPDTIEMVSIVKEQMEAGFTSGYPSFGRWYIEEKEED